MMKASFWDSLEWVCADTPFPTRPLRQTTLEAPRRGLATAMVFCEGLRKGATLSWKIKPALPFQLFRVRDVPVEANTGPVGFIEKPGQHNSHVFRRAPFRVHDALEPLPRRHETEGEREIFRLHVPIPPDAPAGKKTFVLSLCQGRDTLEMAFSLFVPSVVIPPVGRYSWPVTNWFSTENMAIRHGLRPWSEAHWAMIAQYAHLMAHGRQNTFWFTFKDMFDVRNGTLVLHRDRLRRYVNLFTRADLHFIEGGHFGRRSTDEWTCPTFSVSLTGNRATTAEGNADLAAAGRQLMEEIRTNRWEGRYLQHVADEPIPENALDYRLFVGMVRKYMPGIPLVDAVLDPSLPGTVDIWCPQAHHYEQHREQFEAERARGDRIWFYTCCFPGGPWLNRLLDMELIRPVLLGWAAALYRLDGFLHWGLNHYRKDQNPFEQSIVANWGGGNNSLPAGDTHVVYPGTDGPWSSLRFEAQREGLEDLELLRRLQEEKPRLAAAILRPVVQGFSQYTKETAVLRRARRRLWSAVSALK